jgi:hypothetical protein
MMVGQRSGLDRPAARVAALAVAVAVLGLLGYIHRREFLSPEAAPAAATAPDPFTTCMAPRAADIEKMLKDGVIQAAQAELFRSRAEALCRAEAAKASGAVPGAPPGLPPGLRPTQRF